jgi:3-hydroxyisobutyrate dehydrogenase
MFERIGFIGVGAMGTPMSQRLIKAGYKLVVHDIDLEALKKIEKCGAETSSSPQEMAKLCNPIITMLPDSNDVEDVILGPRGIIKGARQGLIIIDMTTSYPLSTKMISARLAEKGAKILDAPVSGGVVGAEKGTLSIMVGGESALVEQCMPLFKVMGEKVFHMGILGSGHTMKAVNNILSGCSMVATSEALAIAVKAGLEPNKVIDVLQVSSGRSWATDYKFPRYVLPRTFDDGFRLKLLNKDLNILTKLAKDLNAPAFIANVVQQIIGLAEMQGYGDKGHTSIAEFIEKWASVKIKG